MSRPFMPALIAVLSLLGGLTPPIFEPDDGGARTARTTSTTIDRALARDVFAEAKALSDADGGNLWGKRLYGPILFVDPATRAVVANVPDDAGHLAHDEELEVYVGRLPDTVSVGNTTTEWAGLQWTMLMWPLAGDRSGRGALMMHERFHRIQRRLRLPLAMPDNHHLDTADGRIWMRLEWRALADAVEADAPLDTPALRDALLFRAYRHGLFENAAREERELELNEGLAEYTGLHLGGLDAAARRARTVAGLRGAGGHGPLVRSFAYTSGPAWGLLLDAAKPGWPRKVRRTTDLADTLGKAIRFRPPAGLEASARERAALYGAEEIIATETGREEERQARLAAFRARYVEGPVLSVDLLGSYNFSFSPYGVQALDGIGTVYTTMELSGPWGILDVRNGVLVTNGGHGPRRVVVPAPADSRARPLEGAGWTMRLERGWWVKPGERAGDFVLRELRGR